LDSESSRLGTGVLGCDGGSAGLGLGISIAALGSASISQEIQPDDVFNFLRSQHFTIAIMIPMMLAMVAVPATDSRYWDAITIILYYNNYEY
jgi:hypothetical protein